MTNNVVAPRRGWPGAGRGRAAHVEGAAEYQATTVQACGLFPFTAGSGSPTAGVPFGRHMMWGEVVCCDPFAWMDAGLTTNRGVFFLGQPGTGKSSGGKRICRGLMAFGAVPLFLGDAKPDYTQLVRSAGGQVIRIGRGLDRINPLDAGPLGAALARMSGPAADRLRLEIRGRRLSATLALCALVRTDAPMSNAEETVIGAAVDLLADRLPAGVDPTVPDVLTVIREGSDRLVSAAEVDTDASTELTRRLRQTLRMLCEGSLKGVFDGPTSTPIDLDAPAVSVDISAVTSAGDTLLSAAMLSTWSYGFAVIDASTALAEAGLAPAKRTSPSWTSCGGPCAARPVSGPRRRPHPRLPRPQRRPHDDDPLPGRPERTPNQGRPRQSPRIIDRCAITVLAGLPLRELDEVARVVPLSGAEKSIVASWSSPETWQPGARHPGRGKYLIKTGQRVGIPVELEYVADEAAFTTPTALRPGRPRDAGARPNRRIPAAGGSALHHPRPLLGSDRRARGGLDRWPDGVPADRARLAGTAVWWTSPAP